MKFRDLPIIAKNDDFVAYGNNEKNTNIKSVLQDLSNYKRYVDEKLGLPKDDKQYNLAFIDKLNKDDFEDKDAFFCKWNTDDLLDKRWVYVYILMPYIYERMNWANAEDAKPDWWIRDGIKWYLVNDLFGFYKNDFLRNLYEINVTRHVYRQRDAIEVLNKFFENENYRKNQSPKLDFFMIKYLHEVEKMDFKAIMNTEFDAKDLISKVYNYYNKVLSTKVSQIVTDYSKLETPEQLLDYINVCFRMYGYMNNKTGKFKRNYDNLHEDYRTATMEEIIKERVLNCCDTSRFAKNFFDKHNIPARMFCIYKNGEKLNMHFFPIYFNGTKWCLFEASNNSQIGITEYDAVEDILGNMCDNFWGMKDHIKEIKQPIPAGLTMNNLVKMLESLPDCDCKCKSTKAEEFELGR